MPVVHGYIRVSTLDQADSGLSLEAQRESIRSAWEANWKGNGYQLGRIYEDKAQSGRIPIASRREGVLLSGDIENGDVVIFPKLDRGFRDTEDALATARIWGERGVRCVFMDFYGLDTLTPVGRMLLGVMALTAEFERSRIGERVREAHAVKKRQGYKFGTLPFGTRMGGQRGSKNRRPVIVPEHFAIGRKIIEWKMGGHSFETICLHLMRSGIERPQGKPRHKVTLLTKKIWSSMAVWRAYRGTLKVLRWIEDGEIEAPDGFCKR